MANKQLIIGTFNECFRKYFYDELVIGKLAHSEFKDGVNKGDEVDVIMPACGGINGGFGIGGICSGLVASVMVLGLLFDEEEIKWKRILFLMSVQERYGSLECGRLSALQTDCNEFLEGIADILQEVIEE